MDDPDLDALAGRLKAAPSLPLGEVAELVVTLAEHHDRRVIAVLIDLIESRRTDEMVVRAAGWMADPALHEPLVRLGASRISDLGDASYWEQVDRAISRCRPEAAAEADEVEVALLTVTQASLVEAGAVMVEVELAGQYPVTEVVLRYGEHIRRHAIWNFDEASPDDPTTLDRGFTLYRIANLATWG